MTQPFECRLVYLKVCTIKFRARVRTRLFVKMCKKQTPRDSHEFKKHSRRVGHNESILWASLCWHACPPYESTLNQAIYLKGYNRESETIGKIIDQTTIRISKCIRLQKHYSYWVEINCNMCKNSGNNNMNKINHIIVLVYMKIFQINDILCIFRLIYSQSIHTF